MANIASKRGKSTLFGNMLVHAFALYVGVGGSKTILQIKGVWVVTELSGTKTLRFIKR